MDLIEAMTIFVEVAEAQGFNRAAEKLRISRSVVTRAIANLEERLSVRLLQRTTRHVTLTEIGRTYLGDCKDILDRIATTEGNVTRSSAASAGTLRVAAASSFALSNLGPVIKSYVDAYPEIDFHLTLLDREVDIVDEGFDAAIVPSRAVTSSSAIVRPLAQFSNSPVVSVSYLDSVGVKSIEHPEELGKLTFIGRSMDEKGVHIDFERGSESTSLELHPRFTANNLLMISRMTRMGMGFSLLPPSLMSNDLAEGSIVRLIPDFNIVERSLNMCIAYPSRKYIRSATQTFIDHVVSWARDDAGGFAADPA
ncbi:LysR family transcriptional regulator [Paraburkholderia terrae]|uniref:LysR family transcriptional regulator n=1 Tax=Paraburkholderia TaxID=1822464 RepID=UPI001EE1CEE1|nr:LysR family transcriptional regulator [Paraburkholderia terrae]BEU21199.1 LysR family transcriptional regulator [Paraburkholderia sp. 22B1P]GJH06762.1 LysR family transcriptional regulator [Paraburkholderia terrae]GJH38697.1 LysR family transcriptional regulator [Paraburkholderia hospita]